MLGYSIEKSSSTTFLYNPGDLTLTFSREGSSKVLLVSASIYTAYNLGLTNFRDCANGFEVVYYEKGKEVKRRVCFEPDAVSEVLLVSASIMPLVSSHL